MSTTESVPAPTGGPAPRIRFPEELPVSQRVEDIAAAIRDHQVVIVAGETGSGKTTQLPKICLALGRGERGKIGHTQPRRIAARTVAERIAEELNTPLGSTVGWKVRFTDRVGADTRIKVMTDGILLAEIQRDRMLRGYDTLIIDEAHERSLNIDFLLGYLKRLLPRRPDLKVIITSATIDPERFSQHFNKAPIVEVSGRMYPVEVRYRPIIDDTLPEVDKDRDQVQAICDAVGELSGGAPGDILVFLSGEREIRDTADALNALELRDTEVMPLYARLSSAEQHRVFQRHSVSRRIVLATNVAETSLTVPGIKYVIDPGTARVSRYSHRLKVQRLPIEAVSQASANQRKGRCGRTSDGICIRLYSEEDFEARPEFTDPEILRTNLASVILQMTAADLGDIADFPFIEPPDKRQITDGVNLLRELGALKEDGARGGREHSSYRLTGIGRKLAQLPVDPRMARMVLEAERNGCAHEVMVIAAALSIQDPRERPSEHQQAADAKHARFTDPTSDFLAYLNLWNYLRERQREQSSSRFRRMCKAEFLNYLRVREWQDVYNQLRDTGKSIGVHARPRYGEVDFHGVHVSLLAGLLSHIGLFDGDPGGGPSERGAGRTPGGGPSERGAGKTQRDYLGARGARFAVFPGSALFRKPPRWLMAAELVETSRLWGRVAARIEPDWVERLAGHLVKRNYSEPHWERKQGAVLALERVTLYGVPIVEGRKVNFGKVDPELCRELFIRHALVDGDWQTNHRFFHANRELLAEVEELEHRARRRDILVDDEVLFEFYDQRIGAEVVSARHFDTWWTQARRERPDLLDFSTDLLINEGTEEVSAADFPPTWTVDGITLRLTYQFEPGADADGVTAHIPLAVLNQVADGGAAGFDWQVPGLREELVTALIKALPKQLRRQLVPAPDTAKAVLARLEPHGEPLPAPDTAKAVLARLEPHGEPLLAALERELYALRGVDISPDAWEFERVPDHLRITFRVLDEQGRTLGEGKDLAELRATLAPSLRGAISRAAGDLERTGLREWSVDALPTSFAAKDERGNPVKGFPALTDAGDAVDVRVFATEAEQAKAMAEGTRRLVLLNVPSPRKALRAQLSNAAKLELSHNPHGGGWARGEGGGKSTGGWARREGGGGKHGVSGLLDDCVACAADKLIADAGGPAWDAEGFARVLDVVRAGLDATVLDTMHRVRVVLVAWRDAELAVKGVSGPGFDPALTDVTRQLSELVYDGFVADTGYARLPDVQRYLRAIERRLEKLPRDLARDSERMRIVAELHEEYRALLAGVPEGHAVPAQLADIRWMLEELRVSQFAQTLGTAFPVSEKRVWRALDEVHGS